MAAVGEFDHPAGLFVFLFLPAEILENNFAKQLSS